MALEPIIRLSDEVIGQIAAGEVVERPAAAVKELVENSIDAGATAVTVELKDGGIGYLRVSDNGKGIPAGQVRMAFERHATSKLRTAEDLFQVRTLGFRGEALASIAAIAKVTCISRAADADFGVKVQVDGGQMGQVQEAASPVGTTITVRELFYNTPVRLKFLKKPAAEAALVSDYMMRLILSRPDIAFRFVNEGKTVYRSAGDGTLESAIYCVYGREALRAMFPVKGGQGGVMLEGYVGVGEQTRGNRLQQSFFINGRYFRSETLGRALEGACEGYVMIGRYPSCVIMLSMPYHLVDVNVHPNKLEVRFQNPDTVARAIADVTRDSLQSVTMRERLYGEPKPEMIKPEGEIALRQWQESGDETPADSPGAATSGHQTMPTGAPGETVPDAGPDQGLPVPAAGIAQPGQDQAQMAWHASTASRTLPTMQEARATLAATGDALYAAPPMQWMADDAANHHEDNVPGTHEGEQITSNQAPVVPLQPDWDAAGECTQTDGIPAPDGRAEDPLYVQDMFEGIDTRAPLRWIGAVFQTYLLFESGERLLMVDQHAAHERVLFDRLMARYEGASITQHLMTPLLIRLTARDVATLAEMEDVLTETGFDVDLFDATSVAVRAVPVILGETAPVRDVLLDVLDEQQLCRGKATRERLRRRVAQMACKHAIKAGDTLTQHDVRLLLEDMLATGAQPTCPHGRPIVTDMTRRDLEKRFKRIQ